MSFAARTWVMAAIVATAATAVGGCANQKTAPAPKREAATEDESRNQQASRRSPRTHFAGPVSLYGELGRRDAGIVPVNASDNLRQVTATREGSDFDVAVSPDGEWLCFASTRHSEMSGLYLRRVDGSTVTQLTSEPGNDVTPTFSPDGEHIAFASDRSGTWNIYLKSIEGGKAVQLTDDPSQELHPSFSPDGRELVFSALSNRSGQWEMVVVDVDNPTRRRFLGFGLFPSFSPDGDRIAFQRARQRGSRTFGIWTVDYEDGEASRPTEIAAAGNAAVITPTWSPDGERLAFATVVDPTSDLTARRPNEAELWAIGIDGTDRVRLTQDTHANLQPAWSADGVIYFISNRNGHENIWSLKPGRSTLVDRQTELPDEPQAAVPTE